MTTKKQDARARFARVAAERAVAQRKNVDDLAGFVTEVSKGFEVHAWLDARIEKLHQEADGRLRRHDVAAGKALAAVRARGESVESIAQQVGISAAKVRAFLKLAEEAPGVEVQPPPVEVSLNGAAVEEVKSGDA